MTDPGLTTPVQPVRPSGGRGTLAAGLAILAVVGLLAWHPWDGTEASVPASPLPALVVPPAPIGPDASTDPDLFGGPTTGPWSGRVTAEWSIVAFLRSDPVSRDPLNLRQQQVAVLYGQPETVGLSDAICDQEGTFLHRAAADLPTREVRYLGIAFPPEESVAVKRVALGGQVVAALPVELGRIPGVGASMPPLPSASLPAAVPLLPIPSPPGPQAGTRYESPPDAPAPRLAPAPASPLGPQAGNTVDGEAALDAGGLLAAGGTVPAAGAQPGGSAGGGSAGGGNARAGTPGEQVRMFALPGGGPWPDGVYRFDLSTHEGLPTTLFACIRP
jgi:hypothetical protein